MVGGWIASYVFIFIFWSRCCCCCCLLLLLLPTTSVLKRREMLGTSIAAVVIGCFYFCPLDWLWLLTALLLRRDACWKNK